MATEQNTFIDLVTPIQQINKIRAKHKLTEKQLEQLKDGIYNKCNVTGMVLDRLGYFDIFND